MIIERANPFQNELQGMCEISGLNPATYTPDPALLLVASQLYGISDRLEDTLLEMKKLKKTLDYGLTVTVEKEDA